MEKDDIDAKTNHVKDKVTLYKIIYKTTKTIQVSLGNYRISLLTYMPIFGQVSWLFELSIA